MKHRNILITGGAGFIGSNLALKLLNRGYITTVLDNLSPQVHQANSPLYISIKDKVKFIRGDIRNRSDWLAALEGQDILVHLAAETGTGQSMYEIEKYVDVNIKGTAILLDILTNEKHSIKKIVVASSRSIYGEGKYACTKCQIVYPSERKDIDMAKGDFRVKCPFCTRDVQALPTDEESRIHPSSIYGITKQNQEQMVLTVGKSLRLPVVAFRYQNVYGPGQSLSNPYTGILSIFSTRINNGNDIIIFEDGYESRDFVFVDDAVNATIMGIEKDEANFQIFNVGSGERTTVLRVADELMKAYVSNVQTRVSGNYRLGDIRENYADLTKIRKKLGFRPKTTFENGIQQFVDWVKCQEIMPDNYDKSINEMAQKGLYK